MTPCRGGLSTLRSTSIVQGREGIYTEDLCGLPGRF